MQLIAYVSPDLVDGLAIRDRLKQSLPDYMVPAAVVTLARLPLSPAGKVNRQALPAPRLESEAYAPPQGELEQAVAAIWSDLLGVARIGRTDSFFDLGGHSLLAMRMISRLRRSLAVELPLRTVFATPQLQSLAASIAALPVTDAAALLPPLVPVTRQATMPLSLAQQRLWLVERLATRASSAYNMCATVRFTGVLSHVHLEGSLNYLLARHESLRSAYPEDDGEPVAVIAPALSLRLNVTDLRHLDAVAQHAEVQQATLSEARTPLDLAQGPLVRASLLRLADEQHLMLFSMHHMVADGWSVGLLINELTHAYRALAQGQMPQLPALPVQYADYAVWQRHLIAGTHGRRQTAFWRQTLAEAPTLLPLPLDRPRPAVASHAGGEIRFALPRALMESVRALAAARRTTPFNVLLASFQWFLHRVSGSADIVLGTDIAGRHQSELEGLIGFFVNVLPLRSRITDGSDFASHIDQTARHTLAAFEHQDLPFDRIVEAVGVARDRRWNPLVQVLFVLQNTPAGQFAMPGLDIDILPAAERSSKFDMALFLEPAADGALTAEWVYAAALFEADTIARWSQAWMTLLQQACQAPDLRFTDFALDSIFDSTPDSRKENASVAMTPSAVPAPDLAGKLGKLAALKKKMPLPAAKPGTAAQSAATPAAPRRAVRLSALTEGQLFPVLVEPESDDLDPVAWARGQRDFIDSTLCRHGGILFRGFGLQSAQDFEAFAEAIDEKLYGEYGDLPKKEGGKKTYRSTPYPEQQMILYHNESAHLDNWPRKQWFFCEIAAPVGGATPIVDCREMLRRLPPDLVEKLESKQLMYVRTFTEKFDVSWRAFYRTDSRAEVEQRCHAAGIDCRWLDGDVLQTRTICPAVIRHPVTGERSFFNQVQLHHLYCLEAQVRDDLLSMVGIDRMPRHVYYGDGTPIEDEVMQLIGELYEACAVRFAWQQGDVVMLDNMLAAHARDPFEGPRKIVVAMSEMTARRQLEATSAATGLVPQLQIQEQEHE
jgi:alpha-ketoglutarate-dependent taurine dioxygenase